MKVRGPRKRGNDDAELLELRERDRQAVVDLFERFGGHLVSPGAAANLLGISRQTVYTLGKRGTLRVFRSEEEVQGGDGPRWVYIPLADVERYADHVGRPLPRWADQERSGLRSP